MTEDYSPNKSKSVGVIRINPLHISTIIFAIALIVVTVSFTKTGNKKQLEYLTLQDSLVKVNTTNVNLKSEIETLRHKINTYEYKNTLYSYSSETPPEEEIYNYSMTTHSYWFVRWLDQAKGVKWNDFWESPRPYFSLEDFYKYTPSGKDKTFVYMFTRITKEAYEANNPIDGNGF